MSDGLAVFHTFAQRFHCYVSRCGVLEVRQERNMSRLIEILLLFFIVTGQSPVIRVGRFNYEYFDYNRIRSNEA